jgi:hypothetical protein
MSLADRVAQATLAEQEAKSLRDALQAEKKLVARLERELGVLERLGASRTVPGWLTKQPRSGKKHHATPWLMLSDLHLDEVVRPQELFWKNAYDREIALQRLKRTVEGAVKICRDYWTGVVYDGIVVVLGGDLVSGAIHPELAESNEDTSLGTVHFWLDHLQTALELLADEFGKVHVPVVVGNHGRMTRKPRSKFRARDNFDWFIGARLQAAFKDDPRLTFDVPESADCLVPSYGQTVMVTHGDQTSGGAGIGGIWPPIMRLDARKSQRQAAIDLPYDLLIMGHWHQLVFGPKFIINGSLKGYDEYAFTSNFGFEPPQQALWLMTPEHGKTWTAPVLSQDRVLEGWGQAT